ncbi:MAG: DUF488 family protein [Desulfurococcaceae archaeon]
MFRLLVYTIGYGGRTLGELIGILRHLGVGVVVDVRRWNTSRRLPEFSGGSLAEALSRVGIKYVWIPELGGYRKFGVDVEDHGVARCFESEGFRAYATYITLNPAVKPYLEKLVKVASSSTSVLLCREKYPWLCHRKILSDYLYAKGFRVLHVIDPENIVEHRLSRCAVVVDGELRYA